MSNEIRTKGNIAWRAYETDGVPSSGKHEPVKAQIADFVEEVNKKVETITVGNGSGLRTFATTSARNAFVHSAPTTGVTAQDLQDGKDYYSNGSAWVLIGNSPATRLVVLESTDATQTTNIGTLTTGLAAEITNRTAAVSTEASTRSAADSTLTTNLATEVTNRTTADATLTTNLATEASTRGAADTALDARTDTIEGGLGLDGGSDSEDLRLLLAFVDQLGKAMAGFNLFGSIEVKGLQLGMGDLAVLSYQDDDSDSPVSWALTDLDGVSWLAGLKNGRVDLRRSDEEEYNIDNTEMVGNPIWLWVDENDRLIARVNGDGTYYARLDQPAIDYIAARLPGAAVDTDIPATLFTADDMVVPPSLGYAQSTEEEGWPARYMFRLDLVSPVVAIAETTERWRIEGGDGQSNNVGGGSNPTNTLIVPPAPHRALTLAGSSYATGSPVFTGNINPTTLEMVDLLPIREGGLHESPYSSKLRYLHARDLAEGVAPQVRLAIATGAGGLRIDELMKGSGDDYYERSTVVFGKMVEHAVRYRAPGLVQYVHHLDQGEGDRAFPTDVATWATRFETYRTDRETDIRALTRQPEPVWHCLRAICAPADGLGTAYLGAQAAMLASPRTTISHSDYFCQGTYGMIAQHFKDLGNGVRGEYMAKAARLIENKIKAAVEGGVDPWTLTIADIRTCLRVSAANRSGVTVTLDLVLPGYETSPTVVEDTTTLPAANTTGIVKGIKLVAGSGAVSAVAVTNPSPGVYKLAVTLSVAGAGTLRGGYDIVNAGTTDRSSAWINFKSPCTQESIAVAGLDLDDWLIPFEISYS